MSLVMCLSLNAESGPHFELLQNAGFEVQVVSRDLDLFQEENLIASLQNAVASIAGSEPYTRSVIESLPNLKVIARTGVGYDAVDLEVCNDQGVAVSITPGVNHHAVAEHTMALLLGVARGFPEEDRRVREGCWQRIARPRVMGCTIGIVGLGRIGQAVATRAVGLGMNVMAFEPCPHQEFVDQWKIDLQDLPTLLKTSDYVSLHCPMSSENHHLINEQTIALMKHGAVLINTARGALVDEKALYQALQSGKIRAAGLDVFEEEPLVKSSSLLNCPNILFSGHIAGLDQESHDGSFGMAAETIIDLAQGNWRADCIVNHLDPASWNWNPTY